MNSIFFELLFFSLCINVSSLRLDHESSSQDSPRIKTHNDLNVSLKWPFLQIETSPVRLVFFAGVEGSGHHLMEAITAALSRNGKEHSLFTARTLSLPKNWGCGHKWDYNVSQNVVTEWKTLQPGLYILPQQMSYPMCGAGNHNGRAHEFFPHIDWMHAAADEAGVKLHIIYLNRPLPDCLAADCLHRKLEPCAKQTETLLYNARELVSQLQKIPKSDYSCFHYGDVNKMQSVVTQSFGVESEAIVKTIYAEHPSQGLRDHLEGWSELEAKLQSINLEMNEACSAVASLSLSEFSLFETKF